jgi:hypothetical protein
MGAGQGVLLQDKPEYFEPWIEFCLQYNPDMVFYLQDAWTGRDSTELVLQTKRLLLIIRIGA